MEAEVTDGVFTLRFVELGEGYSGDYNPDDPDDEELLRVDIFINDYEDNPYPDEAVDSYCTLCGANLTYEERMAVLERWICHMNHSSWKHTIQRLTWEENFHGEAVSV